MQDVGAIRLQKLRTRQGFSAISRYCIVGVVASEDEQLAPRTGKFVKDIHELKCEKSLL
jgi:hypothetical protein